MSKEITAYFKGRIGVAESVYQHDYGRVLVFDDIELPSVFEVHFEIPGDDEAIIVAGQDNRAAIPNVCLDAAGIVTAYVYAHEGQNDGETEYIVRFNVMHRAKPIDDGTEEEQSFMSDAIALMQHVSIEGEVANWLDDHPEATTTVQDGAITTVKLHDGAVTTDKIADGAVAGDNLSDALRKSPFYDVTRYGILPDTDEDLYEALFDFLHDVVADTGGVVYFPEGIYEISDTIFIPPNTVFMGAGASTEIFFNETYSSFGVGLSNAGSNVGIVNMTVNHNNSGKIVSGAITGSIGFSTRTFDSWTTKHQSPSSHESCSNVFAENLWTSTRYILQTETHSESGMGTITGVSYRNIHAKNSLVSVMGHSDNTISDVVIDNVDCAFLRIGILSSAYTNSDIHITNVRAGRIWLVGDMITISNAVLLPGLKYDELDSTSTAAVIFGMGTIVVRDCYINASAYLIGFARMSVKLKMFNCIFFGSTQRVAINADSVYIDETEIIGCSLTTGGSTLTHVEGRMENTYFPSMHYTAKVQPANIGRERLASNTDLDDLKRAGGRYQSLSEVTATLTNKPSDLTTGAFILDVISQVPTDNVANIYEWYIQRIIPTNASAIYIRGWTGSAWTSWYKYAGTAVS